MAAPKKAHKGFGETQGKILTLQSIPRPADTVTERYIEAGWLLAQMDMAGGKRAHSYIGGRAVTVGVDAMSFRKPVFVGDLISIYTQIVAQGRSSLTVKIESWAERLLQKKREKVTEGLFIFVAIDENHKPVEIARKMRKTSTRAIVLPPHATKKTVSSSRGSSSRDRPAPHMDLSLRTIPRPRDTNYLGDIFGGWILSEMDAACAQAARRHTGLTVASVGIEAMTFHKPVRVGDEVSFYTEVVKTGHSSVTIKVETWSARQDGQHVKVTEGLFTYVALDQNHKTVAIKTRS